VNLLSLNPTHYPILHQALSDPRVSRTWRSRGRTISSERFERELLEGVELAAVVVSNQGDVIGLTQMLFYASIDQHAELAVFATADYIGSGKLLEGAAIFIDEIFASFPLRKLYVHMTSTTAASVASVLALGFETEGTLRGHLYVEGAFVDVKIASITPAAFATGICGSAVLRSATTEWKGVPHVVTPETDGSDLPGQLRRISGLERPVLPDDRLVEDLQLDSLGIAEVVALVESCLGRDIADGYLVHARTVGDLLRLFPALGI